MPVLNGTLNGFQVVTKQHCRYIFQFCTLKPQFEKKIKFIALKIGTTSLAGNNPVIGAQAVQDGGVLFTPLSDDILRTYHKKPQVNEFFNKASNTF